MKADLAARGFTPEQIRNMPPKAVQAILREQYATEPPAAAGTEGLRTRDTLRLKQPPAQPPTADQMPPRARNIAAERQDDVLKGSSLPSGGFSAMSVQALHHNGRQKKSSGKRSALSVTKFQI